MSLIYSTTGRTNFPNNDLCGLTDHIPIPSLSEKNLWPLDSGDPSQVKKNSG